MWGISNSQSTGGFMRNDDLETTPTSGFTQNDKQKKFRSQNIVPVTIGHIYQSMKEADTFKIGDQDVHLVTIIGLVVSVEQKNTHIEYIVNDMTGPSIKIQHWMDESNVGSGNDKKPMVENTYIQVFGSVKKMRNEVHVVVFKIRPVTDFNMLTLHILEVMNARQMLEEILKKMQNDKLNAQPVRHMDVDQAPSANMAPTNAADLSNCPQGLTPLQALVYKTIYNCQDFSGCTVEWLMEQVKGQNGQAVSQALTFLCDEGHVYTTIDDLHFKVSDSF